MNKATHNKYIALKLSWQQNLVPSSEIYDIMSPKTEKQSVPDLLVWLSQLAWWLAQEDFIKCMPHLFRIFSWSQIINDDVSSSDYTMLIIG